MKFNKSSGQVSRLLLVLAIVVFVAVVITYLIVRMAEKPTPPPIKPSGTPVVLPVFEKDLGNIRFVFLSALDRGNDLKVSDVKNSQYVNSTQNDLQTQEKFIQVTVGAKNMGTTNTEQSAWDIQNIIDSQNREFVPEDQYTAGPWLPNPNLCGGLLKPAFDPTPCTKIYEVAKGSTGLKIRVETGQDNTAQNLSSGKINSFLIDLIVN